MKNRMKPVKLELRTIDGQRSWQTPITLKKTKFKDEVICETLNFYLYSRRSSYKGPNYDGLYLVTLEFTNFLFKAKIYHKKIWE